MLQICCLASGDVYLYSSGSDRTIRAWRLEDGAEENVVEVRNIVEELHFVS